ncbi:MAG TPA: GNAT family N-acetyltransferase [Ktedonobacteraceae bacterium]
MSAHSIDIRPLASTAEYEGYFRLSNAAFSSEPSEEDALRWLATTKQAPDFDAERLRGAFHEEHLLGGYGLYNRVLRMGAARISTGCIGGVVTSPEARKQGVASALMHDAIDFAHAHKHALLLLDGIPKFYYRFGYTDMFDVTQIEMNRSAILALPPAHYQVREATVDDAPTLLALYLRHLGSYTGSFERSLDLQLHRLQQRRSSRVVALTPQGEIAGYLLHGTDAEAAQGYELAVDSWDALLALLQYHARLLDSEIPPATLLYFLPPDAPTTHWLIDNLEVPDTSQWGSPAEEWGVRRLTMHHRFTGWMACLTNFPVLMDSLLPELQARWQRSLAHWTGTIALTVGDQTSTLRLHDTSVQIAPQAGSTLNQLELSPQALVQLVSGYRPLAHLTSTAHLSDSARAALDILFPTSHTWIPRTDWF